jgi:hypothetical protein
MCGAIITIAHVHHSKPRPQKSDDTSPKEEYFQHMPKTIVKLEIIKKKKKATCIPETVSTLLVFLPRNEMGKTMNVYLPFPISFIVKA